MTQALDFTSKPTVLVVDDLPDNLTLMSNLLKDEYKVKVANHGEKALKIALSDHPPDLILLDIMMPDMDGYEVCSRLKANPASWNIPIIFLTAKAEVEDERRGLELGAVDYITKPIRPSIVLARVRTQLELKAARDILSDQNAFLESEVARRMHENQLIQQVSIHALARLAETRDPETGKHLHRTQEYVRTLAEGLRSHPRFAHYLDQKTIDALVQSAPLHDIGKVGIPDHVLLKPGKLTPDEWEIMKTHAVLDCNAIAQAEADAAKPVGFLAIAKLIARSHHEKWNGSGYPDGLAGDDIPIAARLMALADVFDALTCKRIYKPAFSFDEASRIIVEGKGAHFDPDVVDTFVRHYDRFTAIATAHAE